MDKNNSIIYQELDKLELNELKKIASNWNSTKATAKDKKHFISQLEEVFQDEFLLKGVLEKLTPLQVTIFVHILKNKNVQTLGEIVRKVALPSLNVEIELGVLRKFNLVYQRKNRERLTNNLDKYHSFEEISNLIKLETNHKSDKFKLSMEKYFHKLEINLIHHECLKVLNLKKVDTSEEFYSIAFSNEGISKLLHSLNDIERDVLYQIYIHGGVVETETIRNYIHINRGKFEQIIPSLVGKYLIFDTYYLDEKFVRIATLPKELINYFQTHFFLPVNKKGNKQKQEKVAKNDLDFFLNVKKLSSYISRKGLGLAKSGKIKQADNKRTEQDLLKLDIDIFPEKGQVYQIELILPILKILNMVDVKGENVVLSGNIDEFQQKDIFTLMEQIVHEVNEIRTRRLDPIEVFSAIEVPFYDRSILDKCIQIILHHSRVNISLLFSNVIREHLILSPSFKIKTFEQDLIDIRKEIISAVFYLHLFGFLEVEYPSRNLWLSELGNYYYHSKSLSRATEKGAITINPDFSVIAFPEKCSIQGIHLLKAFTELKDYDRVYTFLINKDAFQEGILLGYDPKQFIQFLKESSKGELAQNLLFLFDDWMSNLPIVIITEDCVLLKTSDSKAMELLLGQIKGKKIIQEEISPNAILIEKSKLQDVIFVAEKLNLIVKLIR